MDEVKFEVVFASGYSEDVTIDREMATEHQYWVEIVGQENPYDSSDEPVSVSGILLDEDGAWQEAIDERLCAAFGLTVEQLYH